MKKADIKKEISVIISRLPDKEALAVKRFAEFVLEKIEKEALEKSHEEGNDTSQKMTPEEYQAWMDSLPEEDEELNEETLNGMEESRKAYEKGNFHSFDEVAEELGL